MRCLQANVPAPLAGRGVVLLGAGGVARAVACGLMDTGAQLYVVARRPQAAAAFAAEVGATALTAEDVKMQAANCLAVVNCTPIGMAPDRHHLPLAIEALPPGCLVFDTIYNPRETLFVRRAAAAGHPTLGGMDMFIMQAQAQFEIFTGHAAFTDGTPPDML